MADRLFGRVMRAIKGVRIGLFKLSDLDDIIGQTGGQIWLPAARLVQKLVAFHHENTVLFFDVPIVARVSCVRRIDLRLFSQDNRWIGRYAQGLQGLEKLYLKYKDRGLVILGFPANNFGAQEPGTNAEIKTFCTRTYQVTLPMFSKISVKGEDKAPLYQYLTEQSPNAATHGDIQWNFTKFLIGKDGKVVARFEPDVTPESPEMEKAIQAALQ